METVELLAFAISMWLLYSAAIRFRRQRWSIFGWELRQRKCLNLFWQGFPRKQTVRQKPTYKYVMGEREPGEHTWVSGAEGWEQRCLIMCYWGGHIPGCLIWRDWEALWKASQTHHLRWGNKGKAFIQWLLPPLVKGSTQGPEPCFQNSLA